MSTSAPKSYCYRRVARVVIEFTTPFHVGTGEGGYGADALVVTDANGLPAIPGSSLAGALKAAFIAYSGQETVDQVFGYQNKDKGRGSRLSITWAAVHNQKNEPVDRLLATSEMNSDKVLQQALQLQIRDHVRLHHRGAAEKGATFDEQPVAAGHRFTFEMELVDRENDADWNALLECLAMNVGPVGNIFHPTFRLGGKTRRGYGAFKVVEILQRSFNLNIADQFNAYAGHPASLAISSAALGEPHPLAQTATNKSAVTITLHVQPRGYWMFGGGEDTGQSNPADMCPVREDRIFWDGDKGTVQEDILLIPGSAIKGAISHRVAFHHNRLSGQTCFADVLATDCQNTVAGFEKANELFKQITGNENIGVKELFGFVAEDKLAAKGKVIIDDFLWNVASPHQQRIAHVSIDRFTGGALPSALFTERPLWQGDFPAITLVILEADFVSKPTRQALKAALADLVEGRLALGAGAGRGLGYFESKKNEPNSIQCSAGEDWFNQDKES